MLNDISGKEMWKNWKEFDGRYAVSSSGRVYSHLKSRLLIPQMHTGGYAKTCFCVDGKYYNRYIHRMVAELFLTDWNTDLQVNHIDGNKWNNSVSNLEMVTPSENMKHADVTGLGGAHHLHYGGKHNLARPIIQLTKDGDYVARYHSTFEAQCTTGVSSGNISGVASGNRKSAGGFLWKWKTDDERGFVK